MREVSFAEVALGDLREIWLYSAITWGEAQADRYFDDIEDVCRDLASGLRIGRTYPEKEGFFKYPVARHLVFYIKVDDGIRVMRVLHQRMDVGEWLE